MICTSTVPYRGKTIHRFSARWTRSSALLPAAEAAEIFAYRDECLSKLRATIGPARSKLIFEIPTKRGSGFFDFWRQICSVDSRKERLAALFREKPARNPFGRFWVSRRNDLRVDMTLFGGDDISGRRPHSAADAWRVLIDTATALQNITATSACWGRACR